MRPDISLFLPGLRKERFLPHLFPSVRKCISFLEGLARISWPRGKPVFCHKVKSRNDLILTKHLPLGLGNRESVTPCFTTDWQVKHWSQSSSTAARWYLQQGESWILMRKVSFYPALLGKGEHSKMVEFFPLLLFSLQVVSNCLRPHELQHARLPCPSLSLRVCSNSCPLSWWYHPNISSSVSPSPPALNLSQHQGLFQWVGSLHHVAKILELQHQSETPGKLLILPWSLSSNLKFVSSFLVFS